MLGLVICGGKSLRMGRDKGLISFHDKTWALIAAEKLSALDIPVRLSISVRQTETYKAYFADELLLLDDDSLGIAGPLLGLLSAHRLYPNEDLFILACDLPLMTDNLLRRLHKEASVNPDFESFVFTRNGTAEPLCAIYRPSGLRKVVDKLQTEGLSSYSMRSVLSMLKVYEQPISKEQEEQFQNFNTPDLL